MRTPDRFAAAIVRAWPSITGLRFSRRSGSMSSVLARRVWVDSQMPRSAISFSVSSSSNWPCSMHFTPASIARRTARVV